jgi:hypothetical protein
MGAPIRLSVDSRRGMMNPRDKMFHTSDPSSPYKSKGAQPKEGIKHFGQVIWRASMRKF